MTDDNFQVKIHAPDRSLMTKIGHANLDHVLTPQVIDAAQKAINNTGDQLFEEGMADLRRLEEAWKALQAASQDTKSHVSAMIDAAFAVKSKSGLAQYDLVSALAKSLQLYCEKLGSEKPAGKTAEIIQWHIGSIRQLFSAKVKGMGGPVGEAIQQEIRRMAPEEKA